jgi:hypothetical protein
MGRRAPGLQPPKIGRQTTPWKCGGGVPLPSYVDADRLGVSAVQNGSLEDVEQEFREKLYSDNAEIIPVEVGEGTVFDTSFAIANTSERERAIIKGVSLEIEHFEPPPDRLRVGCARAPKGGVRQEIIEFEMQLDSESVGVEQPVSTVPEPGTVLELGPDDLQAFKARLTSSAPGVHRYRIVVHYDTSAGRSATAVSEPLEVLFMPSAHDVENLEGLSLAESSEASECSPGEP